MTGQERDYDEVLSRVLHSTTDPIEPVGDGLTKIQARLAEPWLKRQWWLLRGEFMVLGWVIAVRCQSWFSTVRARLRSLPVLASAGAWVFARAPYKAGTPLRKSVGPAMAWLRPALAVAGAVVLVVAGVFALGQIRQTFIGLENDNPLGTSNSSQPSGAGSTNGHGGQAVPGGQSTNQGSARSAKRGSTSRSQVFPSPAACASPSTPPVNPSPTPSPTSPSPTPDPTPTTPSPSPTTPSPSPSISAGPLASGMDDAGQVIWTDALVVCQPTVPAPPASPTNQSSTAA